MFENKKKIYVGNLEYSVTNEDLKNFFVEKGINAKEVNVIRDKYTNRSKGFGFVEVDSDEEIQKAIESLDGQDMKGRTLKISRAEKPKDRGEGERRPRFGGRKN